MNALAELFPSEDYRFHLTLRRGEPREFFQPSATHDTLLAERQKWLAADPDRYAAVRPEGVPLLQEFRSWMEGSALAAEGDPAAIARMLGGRLEPDYLLLSPGADGRFNLVAGCLCFPTSWSLQEQLGRPLDAIHAVVPGLNAALDAPIRQFLARLKPGTGYLRVNWGLAATPERNLHPALGRPRLRSPLDPHRTWLRIERQMLALLPSSAGLLFGIRIELHPLPELLSDPQLRAGLQRALRTMPEALAAYKGLADVREELIALAAG